MQITRTLIASPDRGVRLINGVPRGGPRAVETFFTLTIEFDSEGLASVSISEGRQVDPDEDLPISLD